MRDQDCWSIAIAQNLLQLRDPIEPHPRLRAVPVLRHVQGVGPRLVHVQVHLDVVEGLGRFLEFEKLVSDEAEEAAGREQLESLCRYFQIPKEDLMASSYSDLLGA